MRGVVYCNKCGCSNPPGLKKCQTCNCELGIVRNNPITSADFANRKMAIFDIDNTILDPEQRFIDARRAGVIDKDGAPKGKGGWKARGDFLYTEDRLLKDRVMDNSMDLIEHLMEKGYVIAYCTARPFAHYEATKYQLEQKGFPLFQNGAGEDLLFCKRSLGQKTPLYKKGVVETLQAQYDVRLFFDDQRANAVAALQADVPGVYASVQEYYGMIKGVRGNPYTVEDPDPHGFYAPKPYDQDTADADERKNPKGRFLDGEAATMVFVKPRGLNAWLEIKRMLPGPIMKKRWIKIDKDLIRAHYAEHAHKAHFSKLVDYYDGTWVLALVVSARYDAVRAVIGSSKPDQLKQGDIRKAILDKYGDSSYGLLEDWTSGVDNGIHASDSVEAADRELELWFGRKPDKQPKFLNMSSHPVAKKNDGGFHPFVGLTVPVDDWNKSVEMMVDFYEGMPWLPKWIQGKEPPIIIVGGVTIIVLLAPYVFKAIVGKEPTVQGGNPFNEKDPLPESQRLYLNKLVEDLRRRRPSLMNPRKNPVKRGSDSKGSYYRWGKNQKYYYKTGSKTSRENARKKAHKQAKAAFAGGYQGKYNPGEEHSEDYMVPRDVDTLGKAADRIEDNYYEGLEVPEWWKSKLSVTADRADSLADAISYVADNPNKILKIYSGEPKSKFKNMGVVFAEVQIGRNIAKDVGEVVQSVYRGLIGGRTSMAERRMAMAIASMQKELSDRATDAGGNAIANLKVDYEIVQGTATLTIIAHADAIKMARKPKSNPPRSNPPKSKVEKGKELYKHMNGKTPERTETKTIDIGDVWYQVGEGGCWEIGYMSGKETGSSSQKYRHTFNEETKNGDFPKLYATIPDKGKPMLIITGGTWKIKTDEDGVAWIYD